MYTRMLLLACCASFLVAADTTVADLSTPSWVVTSGTEVPIRARLVGPVAGLTYRAELVSVAGDLRWSQVGKAAEQLSFVVPTDKCAPGDHGVRVVVLKNDQVIDGFERVLMVAEPGDLVLIFGQQPIEVGLRCDAQAVRAKEITVNGVRSWVHEMSYGSQRDAEGWWRSAYVTVTDKAYKNNERPIATIEVAYQHEGDAPVELAVDTAKGSEIVAKGWGNSEKFQVLTADISNARFSTPPVKGAGKDRLAEGCDIRYNACTTDGRIRSIRVYAPDVKNPADWSRFLTAPTFTSKNGWVVAPGGTDAVGITVANAALADWKGTVEIQVCNASGKMLNQQRKSVTIPAKGSLAIAIDLTLPETGEHLLRWRLLRDVKGKEIVDIGWERSAMAATSEYIFALFDREIISRGLDVNTDKMRAVEIKTNGLYRTIWKMSHGSAETGWWRSVRFAITDAAFKNGAAPVVDVRVQFIQRSDAPVTLTADTKRGGGTIANSWGSRGPEYERNPPVRSMFAQVDDAVFNRTDHKSDKVENPADGWDVRFNNCTADGEIRSLIVRRHALKGDGVDWARLLRHTGVTCDRDRWVYTPGESIPVAVGFANRARQAYTETAQVTFEDAFEKNIWTRKMPVNLAPDSESNLEIPIDTTGLPFGVYTLRVKVGTFVETKTLIAITDNEAIPKADEGEFLYGSDCGGSEDVRNLDWADYMGLDMIRNCGRGHQHNRESLSRSIEILKARNFRGHLMMDPAYDKDAGVRAKKQAEVDNFLAWAAEEHGDFLHYYEMGNEPDLPFFYAGTIDDCIAGYKTMYAAIKAHDSNSVVMNGGLCFHGKDGWERAHELIEKVPGNIIDAWAYHGHGPGVQAERNAWERQDKAVRAAGKGDRVYIETESGLSANTPRELMRQAQTIIEKIVYAQSKGAPTFLWFTFHFDDEDYATIEYRSQPRPAVVAHRTMAKYLKNLRYEAQLDMIAPGAEAYAFAGATNPRRAVVLWSDRGTIARTISIGPGVTEVQQVDIFGNVSAANQVTPGLVQVSVDANPVFIVWTAADAAFKASIPAPALAAPEMLRVVPDQPVRLALVANNASDQALTGVLSVTVLGEAPVTVVKIPESITVPAKSSLVTAIDFTVAHVEPSVWPRQWTVFAPISGTVDCSALKDVPKTLSGVKGQMAIPTAEGVINIGDLSGGHDEKKQAVVCSWIDSPVAQTIEVGAAADWWMEWWVNGKSVYSTIDIGNNAGCNILAHTFKIPLQAGKNLIVARVLSGSGGFQVASGGPDEVGRARRERAGTPDIVQVELRVDGRLLASEPIPVVILPALAAREGQAAWSSLAPDGVLGAVYNVFEAQPETHRWYKGADDLSGQVWVRTQGANVQIAVAVRDDLNKPGDSALVRIALGGDAKRLTTVKMTAQRDEASHTTWYEGSLPVAAIGADRFAISVAVIDDDWGELKQRTFWGEGDDPDAWYQAWVPQQK